MVTREAYSHECSSAGFWPGGGAVDDAAFYAYAYPEPAGYAARAVRPAQAYYHPQIREFILPYAAVRRSPEPEAMLLDFLAGHVRSGRRPRPLGPGCAGAA